MAVPDFILRLREKMGHDREGHMRCLADALRDGMGTEAVRPASDPA